MEDSKKSKPRSKIGLVGINSLKDPVPCSTHARARRTIHQYAKQTTPSFTSVLGAQIGHGLCHGELSLPVFQIV